MHSGRSARVRIGQGAAVPPTPCSLTRASSPAPQRSLKRVPHALGAGPIGPQMAVQSARSRRSQPSCARYSSAATANLQIPKSIPESASQMLSGGSFVICSGCVWDRTQRRVASAEFTAGHHGSLLTLKMGPSNSPRRPQYGKTIEKARSDVCARRNSQTQANCAQRTAHINLARCDLNRVPPNQHPSGGPHSAIRGQTSSERLMRSARKRIYAHARRRQPAAPNAPAPAATPPKLTAAVPTRPELSRSKAGVRLDTPPPQTCTRAERRRRPKRKIGQVGS